MKDAITVYPILTQEEINKNIEKAFRIMNNVLYFKDDSDYEGALIKACSILKPSLEGYEIGLNYSDENNIYIYIYKERRNLKW